MLKLFGRAKKGYQPVEVSEHSTVKVGNYLYVWGGRQPDLPEVHDSEKKRAMSSVMEVCHLPTGRWEQKPTTGTPPLGVVGYAATAIGNEIFYYGGYCGHDNCNHNSLYSFNVNTFNWKELSPTTFRDAGPMMKWHCGMVAVQLDGKDYLVVIGGSKLGSKNTTPDQPGAQYSGGRCNEIHYYNLSSGKWISPNVTGDRPPPIYEFTFTSLTNDTAILFGGRTTNGDSNDVYIINFTKTSANCTMLSNPGGSVQWPKGRWGHSSVLIDNSAGPHLLVVGGSANDYGLFDINKRIWKRLENIPDTVTGRYYHSLSVWSVTPTTIWIIVFGGGGGIEVIELRYTSNDWFTSVIPLDQYQEKLQEKRREWEKETRETEQLRRTLQERERELQEERRENEQFRTNLQQQLQEKDAQITDKDQRLTETQEQYQFSQQQLQETQRHLQSREREFQEKEQQFQKQLQQEQQQGKERERQFQEAKVREQNLQQQLQQKQRQLQQLQERDGQFQKKETHHQKETETFWVVNREEITTTQVVLGKGGWGEVKVAYFRGLKVAAKCLHEIIISPYNMSTFTREMNIASKIRHPNLLQFVGATTEGNPIILTELMPTSLRKELETGGLAYPAILSISLDVACALNYLHLFKPHPILHRDVSSANVLLMSIGTAWRAKVSDYGSANLQPLAKTNTPGNPVYSALESFNPREHSPAMDVFSYGILLIEMMICQFPDIEKRKDHIGAIKRPTLKDLIQRCLLENYKRRPTMADIIKELNESIY